MKNKSLYLFISTLFFFLFLMATFMLWPKNTQSQQTSFLQSRCTDECCLEYTQSMEASTQDWNDYLNQILAQPDPTSAKVDTAFEGLRTYDCWLRYTCEAVLFSGVQSVESVAELGIRAVNLGGALPGCQAPEDLNFGNHWADFVKALNEKSDLIASINSPNKLAYLPACMTDLENNNTSPDVALAQRQYQSCLETAQVILGCEGRENCDQSSSAFVGLEIALKQDNAEQKAGALERKLYNINANAAVMEGVVDQVKNFFQSLESRYECAPAECT